MSNSKQVLQGQHKSNGSILGLVSTGMVLLMVFTMGLLKLYSPDLGFHLQSAKWMLDNKQFISTDTFTYTSAGNNYFDLQWLFQLLIYGLYSLGHEKLLIIANALLITLSFVLVLIRVLKNKTAGIAGGYIFTLFSLVTILSVQPLTFEIRPHVLSWIFLNLTLLVLELYKKAKQKLLVLLPLITIAWVNTHSLAVLGLVTTGIYLMGSWLETGKIDKKLLRYWGFSLAAFLVNPYFINGFLFPFSQFFSISGNSLQRSYISEIQSPFSSAEIRMLGGKYLLNPLFLLHVYAGISVLALIHSIRTRQFTNFLLLLSYLFILFLAYKNYGFFVMVSAPIVINYCLRYKFKETKEYKKPQEKAVTNTRNLSRKYRWLSIVAVLIAAVITIGTLTDGYAIFRQSPYRSGLAVDNDQLPVDAIAFLEQNKLRGRILNHLDFGGYLMANYPEKVFIDGRMELPEGSFFTKYFESLTKKNGISALLQEYDPDIILFPYIKATLWWQYFLTHKKSCGYKPVHFDGLAIIYVKSTKYPELTELSETKLLPADGSVKIKELDSLVKNENKPQGVFVLANGLWSKQCFSIADQNKAICSFTFGFNKAAINYSVECIQKSTIHTPNIFKNLSLYYSDKGEYVKAGICNDKSE